LFLCAVVWTVIGCSSVTVRHIKAPALQRPWQSSVVETCELSPRTLQTLHQWDLDHVYRKKPEEAFARLQTRAGQDPEPDQLYALAEMSYVLGQKAERWRKPQAIRFYYLSAGYAYHFLFAEEARQTAKISTTSQEGPRGLESAPSFFDPRFRLACDLYNAGLGKCIRAAQLVGRLDPGRELHLPTEDGLGFNLSV